MLENVKVGDSLYVSSSNGGGNVATVKRITPKCLVVVAYGDSEMTFRRNGRERTSDTWTWHTARPITGDEIVEMRLDDLRDKVQRAVNAHIGTLTTEQCQAILSILGLP